ncbi:MAG TPA: S8 family serine peptidase [Kiritimatiellia bacterium]|nr:S8 family serine peptidase [Kiritimatiellia bacterium]
MKHPLSSLLAMAIVAAAPLLAPAYTFQLLGDRLTLAARDVPLHRLLDSFTHAGVRVEVDPGLDLRLTATAVDIKVEQALEYLLQPYSYVLRWDVIRGPVGDIPRLASLQVFRPGEAWRVQDHPSGDGNFRVARGPLPDSPEFIADEILLALKPGVSADAFRILISQIGGSIIESIPNLGIYRIRLPPGTNIPALVQSLRGQEIISRVEPNYAARLPEALFEQPASDISPELRPRRDNAPAIAVLDSGFRPGFGIDDAVTSRFDAVNPQRALDDPSGHGTQMALVASGAIAPNGAMPTDSSVPIMAIRAFDDNGVTSYFTMMRAIDHAIKEGARVINLSWGSETDSSFLRTTLQYATARGMVAVASAGNEPTGRPVYPAAYPEVISVSALGRDGQPWANSNFGSTVTVTAPGTAAMPVGYQGPPGNYAGTSIASAHASHHIAHYLAANPRANLRAVDAALRQATANTPAPPGHGYGRLDPEAALLLIGPR